MIARLNIFHMVTGALLCVLVCVCAFAAGVAGAAITHEFLPVPTEALERGVPVDASPSEAALTGPLSLVEGLAAVSGRLWVAERINSGPHLGSARVDRFDGGTGVFLPPQYEEEGGVSSLYSGVAVGGALGEERVYVGGAVEVTVGESHIHEFAVAVFGANGKLAGAWDGAGTAAKSFSQIVGVAVDRSDSLETGGDVFVATNIPSSVVDVFAPGVGGGEPALLGELTGTPSGPFVDPQGVAVSPLNGDVFVADGIPELCSRGEAKCVVDVFEPVPGSPGSYAFVKAIAGGPQGPFEWIGSLAVDGAGDLYVVEQGAKIVEQFDAEGNYLGQLTGTGTKGFESLKSIAVDASTGDVYVGDHSKALNLGVVDVFGATRFVPDVTTGTAGVELKHTGMLGSLVEARIDASFDGTVNPVKEGPATCRFAYGVTAAFGSFADCSAAVAEGKSPVAVEGLAEGLSPDTNYSYRLQASDKNGTNNGEATQNMELHTPGPGVVSVSAQDVSATSATLSASIDPNGLATSYFFQYGTGQSYEAEVPLSPGAAVGAGTEPVVVAPRHLQGLEPNTAYHYRVVAVSTLDVEGASVEVAFPSADQTFSTQPLGSGSSLLDGRQWEQVSQVNKHGAVFNPIEGSGVIQSSVDGSAFTYLANIPTEQSVPGYLYKGVQVLSSHTAGGWSSRDIDVAHAAPASISALGKEYRAFSSDLRSAVVEPFGVFNSLSPEVFPSDTERTPYIRHDASCEASPGTCFEPILTSAPGYADVAEGVKFGGNPEGSSLASGYIGEANFVGASPDFSHVILESNVALTPVPGKGELYEWSAGSPASQRLQLVSVLPAKTPGEEAPAPAYASFGSRDEIARNAISGDGSRVFWTEEGGHLYVRDTVKDQTVQIDTPEAACESTGECGEGSPVPIFQLAAEDGSRVLFTDSQRLTGDAGNVPATSDLYECALVESEGQLGCQLRDLTPSPGPRQAADVQGAVIGASTDASWVYFAANGLLGDAKQRGASEGDCKVVSSTGEGQCNLYVLHDGQTRFVAAVSGKDYPDWSGEGGGNLGHLTARVSSNGRWFGFMSQLSLTGYDNTDAVSGKADEEVFLYHAEEDGPGKLVCASCNPSGARPHGVEYGANTRIGGFSVWENGAWLAANIPGWTDYQQDDALYQSRYLSDEGRLFFNSDDALVAEDINDNQDVYEFEPSGVGDCAQVNRSYHAATEGCLGLVSSGVATGESAFLDASENGGDVFFLTNEKLVSQDIDTALDVYDAHVCTSTAPCAAVPAAPPPCTTADACRVAPLPQPAIFGAPASATFTGAGNAAAPGPVVAVKSRSLSRTQKLARALKACRSKRNIRKRQACQRQAQAKYGVKQTVKKIKRGKR